MQHLQNSHVNQNLTQQQRVNQRQTVRQQRVAIFTLRMLWNDKASILLQIMENTIQVQTARGNVHLALLMRSSAEQAKMIPVLVVLEDFIVKLLDFLLLPVVAVRGMFLHLVFYFKLGAESLFVKTTCIESGLGDCKVL